MEAQIFAKLCQVVHRRSRALEYGTVFREDWSKPSKMFQKIAAIGTIAVGACFVYASHIALRQAPPQAQTYTTAVLKCPTTFQLPNRNVTLPRGSQLEFVSRDESEVRVRYRGHQQSIPASDVDLR